MNRLSAEDVFDFVHDPAVIVGALFQLRQLVKQASLFAGEVRRRDYVDRYILVASARDLDVY
ncbi:MAG: hypothetical protein AABO41_24605 [Acidobacteriota bacterium]